MDANRSCEDRDGVSPFHPAGRSVLYHRCIVCEFVFTRDFDALSDAELGQQVYNADYAKADPDFAAARPNYFARTLTKALIPFPGLRMLDYGGGSGRFAESMRSAAFDAMTYDPYFRQDTLDLAVRFPLVTAFEVVEHSRNPLQTFREAMSFLEPDGALLFSTQIRRPKMGVEWPYIAPRNGHFSVHSSTSLHRCAALLGAVRLSFSEGLHIFARSRPNAVARLLLTQGAGAVLYAASLEGATSFLHAWRGIAVATGLTPWRHLFDLRHPIRALRHRVGGALIR